MDSMQEHDVVVESTAHTAGQPEADRMAMASDLPPERRSSMKILMPILVILVIFAIWAFMPRPLDPKLSKLGKVTDKGAYYEIEHAGDAYSAQQELANIFPELIAEKSEPNEGKNEVAVFSGASTPIKVVGLQGTKPSFIRVMKGRNLDMLRGK